MVWPQSLYLKRALTKVVPELVEYWDAGSTFYATDFWSLWDLGIIFVGIAFFVTRMIGLAHHDRAATDVAFDILSIEALFLVPRSASLSVLLATISDS